MSFLGSLLVLAAITLAFLLGIHMERIRNGRTLMGLVENGFLAPEALGIDPDVVALSVLRRAAQERLFREVAENGPACPDPSCAHEHCAVVRNLRAGVEELR